MNPGIEANRSLERHWGDDVPVDPFAIANKMGIEVYVDELDERVSGALVKRISQPPKIILRNDDPRKRQRFTCAHELGHYVSRQPSDIGTDYEYVDLRAAVEGAPSLDETFANQFAAELLMPPEPVGLLWALNPEVRVLARTFDVSEAAMGFRLKNLRLVP